MSSDAANYGIIGAVTAKAVAVGQGASAVVNENSLPSRDDFDAALASLRDEIRALKLPAEHRNAVNEDVAKIEALAGDNPEAKPAAGALLNSLLGKLKTAGVILNTVAGFQAPIKLLASWFQIPLPF